MTKEEATKILARMLETDANDTFLAKSERSAIIYALQEMNGAEKKAPTISKAETKKTWISAAEITEEIKRIVKETVAAERREERRLLEMTRDIVEAEKEFVNRLVEAAKRREGAKNES